MDGHGSTRIRSLGSHDAFLTSLHERLRNEADADVILGETTRRLALHLGASRTGYGEFDDQTTTFIPRQHWTDGSVLTIDDPIPFASFGPAIVASHSAGELWVHEDLDDPKLDAAGRAACETLGIVAVITVPVLKGGKLRSLISVQQSRPRRWHAEDIALVEALADRTWALLERARAEVELERSREALYQSEKMTALGSLLAGVSHELNNPLSIIVAQAELLELESAGTPAAERAGKIRRAAERSARIVQTFLAMARQKAPDRVPLNLNEVVSAALDLTAYGLRSNGITVEQALDPALPQLMGDADQLHQVVVNLIVNALHALQDHRGVRTLTITTRIAPRGMVVLELADTGPGIPDDLQRRIFEPFFTTKPQNVGTGLGLSFSQGIVEAHGGKLELVPSRLGAVFRMTLLAGDREAVSPQGRNGAAVVVESSPKKMCALVVDDEAELAASVADLLTHLGFTVSVAHGGISAQEALKAGHFDLILTDLRMPDLDGPSLYAWACSTRPELASAFAFTTGDTLSPIAAQFLSTAGRPYMEKPFTLASLS